MNALRKKRLAMGLMQKDVADIVGVHASQLRAWESGRELPPEKYMDPLCGVLELDPDTVEWSEGHLRRLEEGGPGERLAMARGEAGLSAEELGRLVGVSLNAILSWERGDRSPSIRMGKKIEQTLGVIIW